MPFGRKKIKPVTFLNIYTLVPNLDEIFILDFHVYLSDLCLINLKPSSRQILIPVDKG